ncbi:hypothetical protein ASPSYDRAFT_831134 [Aspergillus sydowii CBS 593.65]|uniref:Uncharacterized protein n=1 Tax=Aspergillus sydowii CBS 593.65 TaxID=1036612 RepID=A0A1L9TQ78_9EURO|nr:uncharacterized protein ASPSYDRAFT_831134 [Aspergillus sydowii CBS 593.65]OJJ61580.1 hypothetical protein ASPSYDRAFT_831134 [Aspergillus sydowii CBS 593.65]
MQTSWRGRFHLKSTEYTITMHHTVLNNRYWAFEVISRPVLSLLLGTSNWPVALCLLALILQPQASMKYMTSPAALVPPGSDLIYRLSKWPRVEATSPQVHVVIIARVLPALNDAPTSNFPSQLATCISLILGHQLFLFGIIGR